MRTGDNLVKMEVLLLELKEGEEKEMSASPQGHEYVYAKNMCTSPWKVQKLRTGKGAKRGDNRRKWQ